MSFFERRGGNFHQLPLAASQWSADRINGAAVAGLAAHVVEHEHSEGDELTPARFTIDIFRQGRFEETSVTTTRVRTGRNVRIADALIAQGDQPIARAPAVFARPSREPSGRRWNPPTGSYVPPGRLRAAMSTPGICWGSDAHGESWSLMMSEHQNASRKRLWINQTGLVNGEESSPFVRTAMVGELTNTLTSWGDTGIGYINHDVTIVLARMPAGLSIGLEADNHTSGAGLAVGTSSLYDEFGRFGSCSVSSLAYLTGSLDVTGAPSQEEWGARQPGTGRDDLSNVTK
ncbi:thioesterase family protein [Nocardia sp. SYP-A9097]|uniref:acyl-CoA thioesterase domain-containing protein n=1 Tax=Nocardia sp. SYP-A9097 TaxID=2663237 RepID=UPI00129A80AA|nr:acyl-CoA thioesterase domain-containing protein [Nocardia sp. SYP-A9097]MRH92310.1 thioesterase family protein [Nocardia sp. SYP-A9097]